MNATLSFPTPQQSSKQNKRKGTPRARRPYDKKAAREAAADRLDGLSWHELCSLTAELISWLPELQQDEVLNAVDVHTGRALRLAK